MDIPILSDIPPTIRAETERRLAAIESANNVRVVLAVESGSRAWGFASPDSDYDVRFIFAHARDWYLSLSEGRDVIETPIEDDMDVTGWDIRKALRLALGSNPVLIEWLTSPIVYREGPGAEALRAFAVGSRSRRALVRHYLGLLQNSWERDFKDGRSEVSLKKYFYAIRPAAALTWLRARGDSPPMTLAALVEGAGLEPGVAKQIDILRQRKAQTHEIGRGPRIASIDAFVGDVLTWAKVEIATLPVERDQSMQARGDVLFREMISL